MISDHGLQQCNDCDNATDQSPDVISVDDEQCSHCSSDHTQCVMMMMVNTLLLHPETDHNILGHVIVTEINISEHSEEEADHLLNTFSFSSQEYTRTLHFNGDSIVSLDY